MYVMICFHYVIQISINHHEAIVHSLVHNVSESDEALSFILDSKSAVADSETTASEFKTIVSQTDCPNSESAISDSQGSGLAWRFVQPQEAAQIRATPSIPARRTGRGCHAKAAHSVSHRPHLHAALDVHETNKA